jgi:hypothetical protein
MPPAELKAKTGKETDTYSRMKLQGTSARYELSLRLVSGLQFPEV